MNLKKGKWLRPWLGVVFILSSLERDKNVKNLRKSSACCEAKYHSFIAVDHGSFRRSCAQSFPLQSNEAINIAGFCWMH